jgi:pimeloyl-ACP methyl ester carboxylesterase
MSNRPLPFVLVHGAWHNAASWRSVVPLLEADGHAVRTLDLPGAGVNAKAPRTYEKRPLDVAAFAAEPSLNASVTQQERTRAVVSLLDEMAREAGASVVLVGHSLGGLSVTAAAEAAPEHVHAAVYVSGALVPNGMTVQDMLQHPTMADGLLPSLLLADPARVGALRVDPRSDSAEYRRRIKATFYNDLSDADFAAALSGLHCDEPLGVFLAPTAVTPDRFGRIPRHYIRCLHDMTVPVAAQDFMIGAANDAWEEPTSVHTLGTGHSPFYSQPHALADILSDIARDL